MPYKSACGKYFSCRNTITKATEYVTFGFFFQYFGLYSCPTQFLKRLCNILSPVLSNIFNTSITSGVHPSKLKISKITPIFKSEDETDASNYRPISLLSSFNRIFEKLLYYKMKNFIDKNKLIHSSQYDFCKAHSLDHAILDIVETLQNNMDKHYFSCGVFIDLKKAFDTVNHKVLLDNLIFMVFEGLSTSGSSRN